MEYQQFYQQEPQLIDDSLGLGYPSDFAIQSNYSNPEYQSMLYGDCLSLSETSVCSSIMHPADNHPVPEMKMVAQMIANCNNQLSPTKSQYNDDVYVPPMYESWPNHQPMNDMVHQFNMPVYMNDPGLFEKDGTISHSSEDDESVSMSKFSFIRRQNEDACDLTKKRSKKTIKKSSSTEFCHLSKQELIQRVIELEREKQLTSNIEPDQVQLDASDEEQVHSCCWTGCDLVTESLDQLTVHIRDTHIGSGKPAYYCEWESCSRNGKPFTKRHKMQNHMRTHTGERPFECAVQGCDKRFSRLDSLNTHVKTHSNIRPYTCPVENCTKAYFHSRSLRKHAKSHERLHDTYLYPPSCGSEAIHLHQQQEQQQQQQQAFNPNLAMFIHIPNQQQLYYTAPY